MEEAEDAELGQRGEHDDTRVVYVPLVPVCLSSQCATSCSIISVGIV